MSRIFVWIAKKTNRNDGGTTGTRTFRSRIRVLLLYNNNNNFRLAGHQFTHALYMYTTLVLVYYIIIA